MKKFKYFIVGVVAFCCVLLTGCFFDSNSIENLEVTYTVGQQFFVGEEWKDDLIAGTATYSDGSEKSLKREDLTIDTSKYDNTKVGTYKIYCEYEGIKTSLKVNVVDEMTDAYSIKRVTNSMVENSFKEVNNHLEFKCTYISSDASEYDTYYKQTLEYKVIDNNVYEHYILNLTDDNGTAEYMLAELLYVGTKDEGVMSVKYVVAESESTLTYEIETQLSTLQEFETSIKEFATEMSIGRYLDGSQFVNFYTDTYPYYAPSKLVKTDTGYQMTLSENGTIIFKNNKLSEVKGIKIEYETNIPSQLEA